MQSSSLTRTLIGSSGMDEQIASLSGAYDGIVIHMVMLIAASRENYIKELIDTLRPQFH